MVTFFCNPIHHYLLLTFNTEIFDTCQYLRQFSHTLGRILFPAFLHRLLIIFYRSNKEKAANIPQFANKADPVFHHSHHSHDFFERHLYPMFFQDRHKKLGNFFIRFLLNILMIEPNSFFIVELGSRLTTTMQIEEPDQFIH